MGRGWEEDGKRMGRVVLRTRMRMSRMRGMIERILGGGGDWRVNMPDARCPGRKLKISIDPAYISGQA